MILENCHKTQTFSLFPLFFKTGVTPKQDAKTKATRHHLPTPPSARGRASAFIAANNRNN